MENIYLKNSFDDLIIMVDEISDKLENQTAKLDELLELYEAGVYLVKKCSKMLSDAEQKVSVLARDDNGEVVLKPFLTEEN